MTMAMQLLSIWFRRTNAMLISGALIMLLLLVGSIFAPLFFDARSAGNRCNPKA